MKVKIIIEIISLAEDIDTLDTELILDIKRGFTDMTGYDIENIEIEKDIKE